MWSGLSCQHLCTCRPQLRGKLKSGTAEVDTLGPLHLQSAFSASSPVGRPPSHPALCSLLFRDNCDLLEREQSCFWTSVSGSLGPARSPPALLPSSLVGPLRESILRKWLCKYRNFYKWLSPFELSPVLTSPFPYVSMLLYQVLL